MMKQKDKKKNVAVLFSSGLDSTYLIYKNLEAGNNVKPIYVEIKNNENKSKIEKQNVQMLYELFRKNYPNANIDRPEMVSEIMMNNHGDHLIFKQLPIWVFSLNYISFNSIDEIHIGYVSNDDALSYIDDIKKFYNAHRWLHTVKLPKLVFPLTKEIKYDMMRKLPYIYHPYLTSCENPILQPYHMHVKNPDGGLIKKLQFYKPCADCVPCQRIIRDGLGYNDLYNQMIVEHREKMDLGREFFYVKNNKPEVFEQIRKTLYPDYEMISPINVESVANSKVSA